MFEFFLNGFNEGRAIIHLFLHVLVPAVVAWLFVVYVQASKANEHKHFIWIFSVMMATMVVDIDHLLALPVYAPNRCSISFHPLHSTWPMVVYGVMLLWPLILGQRGKALQKPDRLIGWLGAGLVIHMVLDGFDCVWLKGIAGQIPS